MTTTLAEELDKPQNSYGMSVYDLMKYHGLTESAKKVRAVVEELDRQATQWRELARDIYTVLGNSNSMVYVCMEDWIKKMADKEEQGNLLKMAESIEDRLYKIKPHEWSGHFVLPNKENPNV